MTILTVSRIKVHTLIEPTSHTSKDRAHESLLILWVVNTDILDVSSLDKMEKLKLKILLFKRGNVSRHMDMEGIGEVGSTFKFILKVILCTILMVLSHLSATKGLCRGTIECIEISVFLLKLLHCIIDELNDILSRLLSLRSLKILTASKENSKLIQGRDSKRCCHILGKLTYLIFRLKEALIETSLTECHRIRTGLSMLNHIIATLKESSNLFKVHHKLFPEVTLRCLKDQREVEGHRTNVASPNRHILVSLRILPRSEVRPAAHRMDNTLLIRRSVGFRHSAIRSVNS